MVYCSALGCKEKFSKGKGISFHKFPKNQQRRDLWTKYLQRKDFVPTDYSDICSKHFTPDCFDKDRFGGTWLKSDAVPTIFDFPIKTSKRKVLDENMAEEIKLINESSPTPCTDQNRLKYPGEYPNEEAFKLSSKAKLALAVLLKELEQKSKLVKALRQKERRLKKKLKAFQEVIDNLKQEEFISNQTLEDLELSVQSSDSSEKEV